MDQFKNFLQQGIQGIVHKLTKSDTSIKPDQQLENQFNVQPGEECLFKYNCVLNEKIPLQGTLYLYLNKLCFNSSYNSKTLFNQNTIQVIHMEEIIFLKKKKNMYVFKSIEVVVDNNKLYEFSQFKNRNEAYQNINNLLIQFRKLQVNQLNQKQILPQQNQNDQLLELQKLQQKQKNQQQQQQQLDQNKINKAQNHGPDQIEDEQQWLQWALQEIEKQQQQNKVNNNNNQNQNQQQQKQQQQQIDNNDQADQWQQILQDEEFSLKLQEQLIMQQQQQEKIKEEENEEDKVQFIYQDQSEEIKQQDLIVDNQAIQQQIKDQWKDLKENLQPLFNERKQRILKLVMFRHQQSQWQEMTLKNITVREVYSLFFSNIEFIHENGKKFPNFLYYYMSELLHDQQLQISEIIPEPPEFYDNFYSSNKAELIEFSDFSTRHISFVHPLKKQMFMPDKCNCQINEKLYWISDEELLLDRELSFQGIPMSDTFEPRIAQHLIQQGNDVVLKCGFHVFFKKSSWFKNTIEKGAAEENEKTWKEIKNLYIVISDNYKKKRDEKKLVQQNINNKSFIKNVSQIGNFKINEKDYEIVNQEQQNQVQDIQNDQNKVSQEEINQAMNQMQDAVNVTKPACTIF